ncbi:hypothetical protein LCGC14_1155300 [marine sediment metagenome]|uniref:Uncharacterized protein n=1 Tax=marine sediment metagenome TaxID=412755 RepID=A0A0F9LU66_9ZZZZ
MSWAARNPELYSKLFLQGFEEMVYQRFPELNDAPDLVKEAVHHFLEEFLDTFYLGMGKKVRESLGKDNWLADYKEAAYDFFTRLADKEISDAQSDYFADLADNAHTKYGEQR